MGRKIVLFEINEVPVRIFEHFRRAYPTSTLARLWNQCWRYETYTEDQGFLEPWITWPTVHRGVANDRHEIADLGQDVTRQDAEFPPIWKILAEHGIRTGVLGSLHTYPMPANLENYEFFVPDTFAAGSESFPQNLSQFQEFNLSLARQSARNVSSRVPWQSALALLTKGPELGFRLSTLADLGGQLMNERIHSWQKTRRRSYQAVLSFDIFMKQLEKTRPDFSTFFTNHVASSLHRYWAAAFPQDYTSFTCTEDWVRTFEREIDFTMGKFDGFLKRLVHFADDNPDYQIWITTSMGQAATEARPCESQLYCVSPDKFMAQMGVKPEEWSRRPAMLPQCNVVIPEEKAQEFRENLQSLQLEGQPMQFREATQGFFSLDFGQEGFSGKKSFAQFRGRSIPFEELGLEAVAIEDRAWSSAYHIPKGTLLIYDPVNPAQKPDITQISTLEIAPAILNNFGVPVPSYMRVVQPLAGSKAA